MHCKFLVFLPIVFFFFFSSACEFRFIERIGAHGKQNPDFIVIYYFMAPKVSVVFHKLARMALASCWRYSNVTPLSQFGSPSLITSEYHPISITLALFMAFECLLSKCFNAYAETNALFPQSTI